MYEGVVSLLCDRYVTGGGGVSLLDPAISQGVHLQKKKDKLS